MAESYENELTPPKTDRRNTAHAIIKAGISAAPITGGPAAELFELVVAPPLERRRVEWMNAVAERLMELEKKVEGFKIENLKDNEVFITVVTQATVTAMRNHQKEKIEALENAVVNSALGIDIEENLQLMFLNMIDSFTPLHLKILEYFDNPKVFLESRRIRFDTSVGSPSHGLEAAFQELRGRRDIYDAIIQDLSNRGLLDADKSTIHTGMTSPGILARRTSDLGHKFLRYIASQT